MRQRLREAWIAGLIGGIGAGCGGPLLFLPGGALHGEIVEAPVTDWSFVEGGPIVLEVRPSSPYSVHVGCVIRAGRLYIDPAEGRRWLDFIRDDPRVRVRVDGRIYAARAVRVDAPEELAGFEPDRHVYRIEGTRPWN